MLVILIFSLTMAFHKTSLPKEEVRTPNEIRAIDFTEVNVQDIPFDSVLQNARLEYTTDWVASMEASMKQERMRKLHMKMLLRSDQYKK